MSSPESATAVATTATTATATATAEAAGDSWRSAWNAALAAVEIDVDEAERLIEAMHAGGEEPPPPSASDWVAPALLGPVPSEFADRARALLQRQADVGGRLAEAMVTARAQRRALGKMDAAESRPVFVDTAL